MPRSDRSTSNPRSRLTSAPGARLILVALLILGSAPGKSAELPGLVHGSPELPRLADVKEGQLTGGFKHALVEALGQRLAVPTDHRHCHLQRCLRSLHSGDINLMVLVTVTAERQQQMHFLDVWPNPVGATFYTRPGESHRLQSYDDLLSLRIGVVDGYSQFEPFDSDPRLHKVSVSSEEQLSKMLLGNRLDTYIGYEPRPLLVKAPYTHPLRDVALLAVSKASTLAEHLPALQQALHDLRLDGSLDRLWRAHFDETPRPYRPALTAPERRRGPP